MYVDIYIEGIVYKPCDSYQRLHNSLICQWFMEMKYIICVCLCIGVLIVCEVGFFGVWRGLE